VETEGEKRKKGDTATPHEFEISHSSITHTFANKSDIPKFKIKGSLNSLMCPLSSPLTGHLSVATCQVPVTGIDLVLYRVELCPELAKQQQTEILSMQIAEGDVMRGASIPVHLVFPRFFVSPTTSNSMFSLGFRISINVFFGNNYSVSENFDIVTKRIK